MSSSFAPQHALALAFEDVTHRDRAALHEYLRVLLGGRPFSWRTVEEDGRTVVELYGVLRADSDTRRAGPPRRRRLAASCASSAASRAPTACKSGSTSCARCRRRDCTSSSVPIPFIHQANLITNLLERQEVESFFAPYSCAACGLDEERLIDVRRDLDGGKRRTPPPQKCSSCGAPLAFDELVDQYFAFLDR